MTFLVAVKAERASKMNQVYDVTVSLSLSAAQWTERPASDKELTLFVLILSLPRVPEAFHAWFPVSVKSSGILSQTQNVNSPLHTPHEN